MGVCVLLTFGLITLMTSVGARALTEQPPSGPKVAQGYAWQIDGTDFSSVIVFKAVFAR